MLKCAISDWLSGGERFNKALWRSSARITDLQLFRSWAGIWIWLFEQFSWLPPSL